MRSGVQGGCDVCKKHGNKCVGIADGALNMDLMGILFDCEEVVTRFREGDLDLPTFIQSGDGAYLKALLGRWGARLYRFQRAIAVGDARCPTATLKRSGAPVPGSAVQLPYTTGTPVVAAGTPVPAGAGGVSASQGAVASVGAENAAGVATLSGEMMGLRARVAKQDLVIARLEARVAALEGGEPVEPPKPKGRKRKPADEAPSAPPPRKVSRPLVPD